MRIILALLCGLGIVAPFATGASDRVSAATSSNLLQAFNGESNAHARYLVFAEKADTEGYAGVGSLFRAAARAEQIHAANHAAVIAAFGLPAPDAVLDEPVVKSTRENLEAALKGETYERDEMYPAFIRQAQSERNTAALRTLTYARAAEVEHAKLYAAALQTFETMTQSVVYYVCPVCGYTSATGEFERCPTSGTPRERFEQVK